MLFIFTALLSRLDSSFAQHTQMRLTTEKFKMGEYIVDAIAEEDMRGWSLRVEIGKMRKIPEIDYKNVSVAVYDDKGQRIDVSAVETGIWKWYSMHGQDFTAVGQYRFPSEKEQLPKKVEVAMGEAKHAFSFAESGEKQK